MANDNPRVEMLRDVLTSSVDTFKENTRISALLDDKAQKTAGVAGLFLAAAFGFAKKDNLADLSQLLGRSGIGLLAGVVFLFLCSIFASLTVMWARAGLGPPAPKNLFEITQLLLKIENGTSEERQENHLRDQIRAWLSVLSTQESVNQSKARRLKTGQWVLAAAMVFLSIIIVRLILVASGWQAS
jgi:hypothetical protein